jgi:hypothetical protein
MISHQGIQFQHAFQAALYLGLRKKEWLFLTSHNHWIVIRLVPRTNAQPFLTFSPLITMEGSSVPFRAFLGAILSVAKGGVVEPSVFNDPQPLDTIEEGPREEESPPPHDDGDDGSGEYRGAVNSNEGRRPGTRANPAEDSLSLTVRTSYARFYLNRLKFILIGFNLFPTFSSFISSLDPCPSFFEQSV